MNRAPSFSVSPCLFIGLGTNGWQILNDLRKLTFEEFGRAGLPCFRYLGIETDVRNRSDNSFLPHTPEDDEVIHPIYTTIPDISVVKRRIDPKCPDEYVEGLEAWLDPGLIDRGNKSYESGAGHIRQAGRLCLWENWEDTRNRIRSALDDIRDSTNKALTEEFLRNDYIKRKQIDLGSSGGSLVEITPKIYIFGTLCGGTCSGTFLDIAYFVSQQLGIRGRSGLRTGKHPEVIGMFTVIDTLRETQPDHLRHVVNCWAALRELDFYYQPKTTYRAQFPDRLRIETNDEPFDTVYIESMRNQGNAGFTGESQEGLTHMLAMNLFTEVVAGMSAIKDANRANLRSGETGYLQPNQYDHIRAFSSFGLSAIWYPRYRISRSINRRLALEMISGWLGDPEVSRNKINDAVDADWRRIVQRAEGSLLGTIDGAHNNVNLIAEVRSLFEDRRLEFMAMDADGFSSYVTRFPPDASALSDRLKGPNGAYYLKIAYARELVGQDFRADVEGAILEGIRDRAIAETRVYLEGVRARVDAAIEALPEQAPIFSLDIDLSLGSEVFRDRWSAVLGRKSEATREYKEAIWEHFQTQVNDYIEGVRDYFLREMLIGCRPFLARLAEKLERLGSGLEGLRSICERQLKTWESLSAPNNVAIVTRGLISEKGATGVREDVEVGAAEVLKSQDRNALRARFFQAVDPVELVAEGRPPEDLIGAVDEAYDGLSQGVCSRFAITKEVIMALRHRMVHLVQSSLPYMEPVSSFRPMSTPQNPNILFCGDRNASEELGRLTADLLVDKQYDRRGSSLEHFVLFYQESPGIAISDLALSSFGAERLAELESDERRAATNFTQKSGERFFNLELIRDFDTLREWLTTMRYLGPELFTEVGGETVLTYKSRLGLTEDIRVDDDHSVRRYLEDNALDSALGRFHEALREKGQEEVIRRMEARLETCENMTERREVQDRHRRIMEAVWPTEAA